MSLNIRKYWLDILAPVLRREQPPMIPQAVVVRHERVLMVQRDTPMLWELPGGSMMAGETPEETVVREVKEETGVEVRIDALLGWYQRTGFRAHVSPVYICRPIGGRLQAHNEDVLQVRYFSLSTLPRGQFPWYRPILETDLLSTDSRPLQRTQHLGPGVLLRCAGLDMACRLGLFS